MAIILFTCAPFEFLYVDLWSHLPSFSPWWLDHSIGLNVEGGKCGILDHRDGRIYTRVNWFFTRLPANSSKQRKRNRLQILIDHDLWYTFEKKKKKNIFTLGFVSFRMNMLRK